MLNVSIVPLLRLMLDMRRFVGILHFMVVCSRCYARATLQTLEPTFQIWAHSKKLGTLIPKLSPNVHVHAHSTVKQSRIDVDGIKAPSQDIAAAAIVNQTRHS